MMGKIVLLKAWRQVREHGRSEVSVDRHRHRHRDFVSAIIVTEIGKERASEEDPPSAGIFGVAGCRRTMQQGFPLKAFPLIGNPIFQLSGLAVAMHVNRDGALGQARLSQALLDQLAQAVLIGHLL